MNNGRPGGKTTIMLADFYARGKKGEAVVLKTPQGDFMTPEAIKRTLAAQKKRVINAMKKKYNLP